MPRARLRQTSPSSVATDRGGGSIADLDGDGGRDIVGATWTSKQLLAFDAQGTLRAGFPVALPDGIWSSVAIGDLDGDHHPELVFGSSGSTLLAFRGNGTEFRDGDSNPATVGVFKNLGSGFNIGTPALAPLLGPGQPAIIYGSADGFLYAWRPDGTNLPGFPVNIGAAILSSVAVGKLDGPAGPLSIVVPDVNGALHVRAANGASRPGFPVFLPLAGIGQGSSPALADMNGDGFTDIVVASSNGRVYVFEPDRRSGGPVDGRFALLAAPRRCHAGESGGGRYQRRWLERRRGGRPGRIARGAEWCERGDASRIPDHDRCRGVRDCGASATVMATG